LEPICFEMIYVYILTFNRNVFMIIFKATILMKNLD